MANSTKPSQLDVPTKPRSQRSPSQLFASTPMFSGLGSQNVSRLDLSSPHGDSADPQRLPRPQAAASLAAPSVRPSIGRPPTSDGHAASSFSRAATKHDDFHPQAIWAEMQRTLADVELSALNASSSSHIFGATHSRALEELRSAQLALAQAWARGEADDIGGTETDDSSSSDSEFATVRKVEGLTSSPTQTRDRLPNNGHTTSPKSHRRGSSAASNGAIVEDLEGETERDIQLARKRRAANDRYFQQVNKGVLEVVAKLDDVANAMKQVERESREVWKDGSVASPDAENEPKPPFGDGDFDHHDWTYDDKDLELDHVLTRTTTAGTGLLSNTDTEPLSDDPETPKRDAGKSQQN